MFRGYMPALTFVVFAIGAGIGISFSRGWIPLSLDAAKSGSLSLEVTHREPLPPPEESVELPTSELENSTEQPEADETVVFEQQNEPEITDSIAKVSNSEQEPNRTHVISAVRKDETSDDDATDFEDASASIKKPVEQPQAHVRTRQRDRTSETIETGIPKKNGLIPRNREITVTAHQDPSDSANDARVTDTTSVRDQLAAADSKLEAGEILAAHRIYSKLYWNHKEIRPKIQDKLDANAKAIFFQSQPHFVEPYVIQPGERLEVIARKYQLSWEYLAKLNRTDPKRIQIGQKLKVIKGPFGAVVDLHDFNLTIHLQGYYVKRYTVCTGKDGSSPIGKFTVLNKVENPPYTGPDGKVIAANDPTNPLGERWIDLGDSYGIHGTIDPDSIGKAESRGCIRLGDHDVIEVYNFLVKGSEVSIRK
jgi:lipoprotein-anchoring transpeptidase ErfK/SrfK